MTSNKISRSFLCLGAAFAGVGAVLGGCSTVKSISPFTSNVPYAQDVQPTLPRPAITEIPAYKPKPEVQPAPKPRAAPAAETAPAEPAKPDSAAPAAAPASSATPAAPPPAEPAAPQASQSSTVQPAASKLASAQPVAPPPPAENPVPASPAAPNPAAPTPAAPNPAAASPSAASPSAAGPATGAESEVASGPSIPAADRKLSEDGAYPNLAQVPARPVNMPTFAEAHALEKTLLADREKAKDAAPASPAAPEVDSTAAPVPVPEAKPPVQAEAAPVTPRAEDKSPCLTGNGTSGELAATFHFDPGSAAMTAANLALLAEAMPTVRGATGTIRVFGHGDNDTAPGSRFDLAAARAQAVAQAIAGFGIPAPRIAVGVACADAAFAGSSVQLYAES